MYNSTTGFGSIKSYTNFSVTEHLCNCCPLLSHSSAMGSYVSSSVTAILRLFFPAAESIFLWRRQRRTHFCVILAMIVSIFFIFSHSRLELRLHVLLVTWSKQSCLNLSRSLTQTRGYRYLQWLTFVHCFNYRDHRLSIMPRPKQKTEDLS